MRILILLLVISIGPLAASDNGSGGFQGASYSVKGGDGNPAQLDLYNAAGTYYMRFLPPALTANFTVQWPNGVGLQGQVLITDGASALTWGIDILGSSTNDTASAGYKGEPARSFVTNVNAPASGTFGDITSISLTAGDWDVSQNCNMQANGASITASTLTCTSTTAGNDGAGCAEGDNSTNVLVTNRASFIVPSYRISLAVTTTVYAKVKVNTYTAGPPLFNCRLSARRIR